MEIPTPNQNPHLIKKYANRRLYDTHKSAYITLDDLRQYIKDYVAFTVIDVKTKENITKSCLIQIIFELEASQNPLFSEQTLSDIVRFYDNPLRTSFRDTLEKTFNMFNLQQSYKNMSFWK